MTQNTQNTGPKHPVWDGSKTLDPTDSLNCEGAELMAKFFLAQGFCEPPSWEEVGDDYRFGFRHMAELQRQAIAAERKRNAQLQELLTISEEQVMRLLEEREFRGFMPFGAQTE